MEIFLAFLLFLVLVGGIVMVYFNKIVKLKVRVSEAWSDINVQLKRRHDLIGNLVETVKGYASHEKETLEKVIQARNAAKQAEQNGGLAEIQSAERNLSAALGGLNINALSEAYPDLKANTSFNNLMAELSDTENKIAASRRFYNTTVLSLNTMIQQFPGMLFAGLAGATIQKFFELDEDEKAQVQDAPSIDFSTAKKVKEQSEDKAAPAPAPAPQAKPQAAPATPTPTPQTPTNPATESTPAPAPTEVPKTETAAPPAEKQKAEEKPAPVEEAPKTEESDEEKNKEK